jgi:hypothetical protein
LYGAGSVRRLRSWRWMLDTARDGKRLNGDLARRAIAFLIDE